MSEIDNELQQRLKRFADEVSPEPDGGTRVLRTARTRRRVAAVGAGLMAIVLIGGVAGATGLLGGTDRIDPAPRPERGRSFARYFFEVDQGNASASGTLEVNAARRSLCLEVQTRDITASHLLIEDLDRPAGTGRWSVAFTFFEPDDSDVGATLPPSGTHCFSGEQLQDLEQEVLTELVTTPERFRVDFHRGPNDEPGLVAELMTAEEAFAGTTYVDQEDRVSVHVPSGWHVAPRSLTPKLIDPKEILSLGTAPMPVADGPCAHQPGKALESMSEVDAFVSVQEASADANHPPRPESFEAEVESRKDRFQTCAELDEVQTYWVPFSDEGRNFYLLAAVGNASIGRMREMWKVIESLDFSPEGDEQESNPDGWRDTLETQGGIVRLEVSPPNPELGLVPRLVLSNETQGEIRYGHDYVLERRTRSGWRAVRDRATPADIACASTSELITLQPGEETSHIIGPRDRDCGVLPLRSGIYRVTKDTELESGERVPLVAEFEVGKRPVACEIPIAGECGELQWTEDVAAAAGFRWSFQDGGGAPEITRSHVTFMFWAFIPEQQEGRPAILAEEGYERVGQAAGIPVFSDGQRLTWKVHGLHVWLSGVDGIDASTPGVKNVVEASVRVPYPNS